MDGVHAGEVDDLLHVGGVDAAGGHDGNASAGFLHELLEEGGAGEGVGGLSGGEEGVEAEGDDFLEGVEGVGAEVEGAVEGELRLGGRLAELEHGGGIDGAVGVEGADDDAGGAFAYGDLYLLMHEGDFAGVVAEVALAGAYEYVDGGNVKLHGLSDEA